MASIVDSEAHFSQRLVELGLGDSFCASLKGSGVKTLSHLAFALGQPNQAISNDDLTTFLQNVIGRDPTIQESSSIKRLTFEAQTFVISVLRQGLEQQDASAPRLPVQKGPHVCKLKKALTGLSLTGELDPAHVLLDRASAIYDQNVVKYLEPSSCNSRSHEIQGRKESKELSLEKGSLVLKNPNEKLSSPTDTELKMHYATQRRGIALQFANLMTYAQHNEWLTFWVDSLHRGSPRGIKGQAWLRYSNVTGQLMRAYAQRAFGGVDLLAHFLLVASGARVRHSKSCPGHSEALERS
ncbi:unnamed protein product [Durusdinium trenchii]|uniref:Uncharacterized protein n=1 Tax=Durusdinium trenchii TaxID=1381693 RepID=A0ABP0SK33_9DINO